MGPSTLAAPHLVFQEHQKVHYHVNVLFATRYVVACECQRCYATLQGACHDYPVKTFREV